MGRDMKSLLGRESSHLLAGTHFATCVIVGLVGGYAVDRHFGCRPWGVTVGALLGTVSAFWCVIRPLLRNGTGQPPEPAQDERE